VTSALNCEELAQKISGAVPGADAAADKAAVIVAPDSIYKVAEYLSSTPGLDFNYLSNLTAVDYMDYFEIVYHLMSLTRNHSMCLKARCRGRENPALPSVASLWRSADYQEREIFDLLGISFTGHPNLKRLLLWEGFPGHPLRRDYL
jgi:NADH-quinone oxidoreductase subunit C